MNARIIKSIVRQWKYEAKVTSMIQFKCTRDGEITIYTSQPGFMVGMHGSIIKKFRDIFKDEIRGFENIRLVEVERYSI